MSDPVALQPWFDPIAVPPPSGRQESAWWACLLAHASALDTFYGRVQRRHRLSSTLDKIQEESLRALVRYSGREYASIARGYGLDAGAEVPLSMGAELGWWSEAARASFALAAVLGLSDRPHPDAKLACDLHRKIRMGVFLMVPDRESDRILLRAVGEEAQDFLKVVAGRQFAVEGGECVS